MSQLKGITQPENRDAVFEKLLADAKRPAMKDELKKAGYPQE